jgi:uncharacterized protein (UPF0303 family)
VTAPARDTVAALEAEAAALVLDSFTAADAWAIGSSIVRVAQQRGLGVAVDVRRPTQILFHAALPGATADNDRWIERKAATAFRFESSTWLLAQRFADAGATPDEGWLDSRSYVLAGGAVPVVVRGAGVVAVATVSGLTSAEDHALVVDALREHLAA